VIPSFFVPERISADIELAEGDPSVSLERPAPIPDQWVAEWAVSTGRDPAEALEEAATFQPVMLTYKDKPAFAAANHDQFLARKQVILSALPEEWSGNLMGQMLDIDERLNADGYLRLATAQRTSRHLGNQLPSEIGKELGLSADGVPDQPVNRRSPHEVAPWFKRFLRWRPIRSLLLALYSRLFHWINLD
jgi:hypothetical protein